MVRLGTEKITVQASFIIQARNVHFEGRQDWAAILRGHYGLTSDTFSKNRHQMKNMDIIQLIIHDFVLDRWFGHRKVEHIF